MLVKEARYDVNLCEQVGLALLLGASSALRVGPARARCTMLQSTPVCLPEAAELFARCPMLFASADTRVCRSAHRVPYASIPLRPLPFIALHLIKDRPMQVAPYHTPLHVAVEAQADASLLVLLELGGDTQVICVRAPLRPRKSRCLHD